MGYHYLRMARTSPPARNDNPARLVEPLTDRELDILRLLVKRLSNDEIAHTLILSVSTVKWYVKQIFGKLEVHSRAEAVARATQLGLLSEVPAPLLPLADESTPPIEPVFVARARELERLAGLFERVLAGESQIVFIVGEAGQGKTALLSEFARRVQQTHASVLIASGRLQCIFGSGRSVSTVPRHSRYVVWQPRSEMDRRDARSRSRAAPVVGFAAHAQHRDQ